MPFSSHQGYILSAWLITRDDDLDHLADAVFARFLHRSLTLPFLSLSRLCSLESNHYVQPWHQSGELCASQIISKCLRRVPSEQAALVFTFSDDTTHIEVKKQGQAVRSWRDGACFVAPEIYGSFHSVGHLLRCWISTYWIELNNHHHYQKKKKKPYEGHGCLGISLFLNIFTYLFSCLFLAVLGLHCCSRAFSGCG